MFVRCSLFKSLSVLVITTILQACGGGGGSSGSDMVSNSRPTPTVTPTQVPTATPSPSPTLSPTPTPSPTQTPSPTPTPMGENIKIEIQDVSASAFQDPYQASNVVDLDTSDTSRWSAEGRSDTWLQVDLGSSQVFNTLDILFLNNDERDTCFSILTSDDTVNWVEQRADIVSNGERLFSIDDVEARYIRYQGQGNSDSAWNSIIEIAVYRNVLDNTVDTSDGDSLSVCGSDNSGGSGVVEGEFTQGSGEDFIAGNPDPLLSPGENFDLSGWKITYPEADGDVDPPEVRENAFYTDDTTGAMVFECVNRGGQTSSSTKYSRSELREMLRGGSGTRSLGNNWVISTASESDRLEAGGVDGNMKATVAVDRVSTSVTEGDEFMLGRVIVGQIHASEDEPFKVYYRKLPDNENGSVYFSYEDADTEVYFNMIGDRSSNDNPVDGIALGEKWAYEVDVVGREMTVTIIRENGDYVRQVVTWASLYDSDWFYFKAGNYNQNNGGDEGDYARVSFFNLEVSH